MYYKENFISFPFMFLEALKKSLCVTLHWYWYCVHNMAVIQLCNTIEHFMHTWTFQNTVPGIGLILGEHFGNYYVPVVHLPH